jgi:hypothetical protein
MAHRHRAPVLLSCGMTYGQIIRQNQLFDFWSRRNENINKNKCVFIPLLYIDQKFEFGSCILIFPIFVYFLVMIANVKRLVMGHAHMGLVNRSFLTFLVLIGSQLSRNAYERGENGINCPLHVHFTTTSINRPSFLDSLACEW